MCHLLLPGHLRNYLLSPDSHANLIDRESAGPGAARKSFLITIHHIYFCILLSTILIYMKN